MIKFDQGFGLLQNTQEHMNKLRYINGEARKPKSEREFSLYQQVKEKRDQAQKQAAEAKDYTQKAKQYVSTQISKAEQAKKEANKAIERQGLAEQSTAEEKELAEAYRRKAENYEWSISKMRADRIQEEAAHAKIKSDLRLFRNNMSELIDGITNWLEETFSARRKDIQEKCLERARKAYERVRENDKSEDGRFTKKAEAQVDTQLAELELYDNEILDIPPVKEIRRKIIRP